MFTENLVQDRFRFICTGKNRSYQYCLLSLKRYMFNCIYHILSICCIIGNILECIILIKIITSKFFERVKLYLFRLIPDFSILKEEKYFLKIIPGPFEVRIDSKKERKTKEICTGNCTKCWCMRSLPNLFLCEFCTKSITLQFSLSFSFF